LLDLFRILNNTMISHSVKNRAESLILVLSTFASALYAQSNINYNQLSGQQLNERTNTITTAVPFLSISPDSRAGGMGDAGVASSADVNAIHWNASKLAFVEKQMGFGMAYTPWLKALVPDINMYYMSGYYKLKSSGTLGASLRYFSLGDIIFTDINGNTVGQFRPNEYSIDVAYAKRLSKEFSIGGAIRYINSSLTRGTFVDGAATRPGRAVAVDISALYRKEEIKLGEKKATFSAGLNISNIGNKMTYTNANTTLNTSNFLPMNMRLGAGFDIKLDEYNSIVIVADVNKLLVPTPPVYQFDAGGNKIPDGNGGYEIAYGKNPNRGVASSVFTSFNDAPGGGKEELREFNYATGLEYWYNKMFALRTGYFHEHLNKGGRQYLTMGAGMRFNVFGLDFAYLVPTQKAIRSPLQNTIRVSLVFDFDAFKAQNKVEGIVD
jgi:hypothetical protein